MSTTESGAGSKGEGDERGEDASVDGVLAAVLLGLTLGGGRRGLYLLLGEEDSSSRCCGGGGAAGGRQVGEVRLGEDEVETEC